MRLSASERIFQSLKEFLLFLHEAVEPIGSPVEAKIEQLLMRVHSAFYVAKE